MGFVGDILGSAGKAIGSVVGGISKVVSGVIGWLVPKPIIPSGYAGTPASQGVLVNKDSNNALDRRKENLSWRLMSKKSQNGIRNKSSKRIKKY